MESHHGPTTEGTCGSRVENGIQAQTWIRGCPPGPQAHPLVVPQAPVNERANILVARAVPSWGPRSMG